MAVQLELVQELTQSPYPDIARLETQRSRGVWNFRKIARYHGTGVLIGQRFILTAPTMSTEPISASLTPLRYP